MTNFEKIKQMSVEEMENFIRAISLGFDPWCDRHCKMQGEDNCNTCLAKWLESEVEDNASVENN